MTLPEARAMYLIWRIDAASGGRYRRYEDGLEPASSRLESSHHAALRWAGNSLVAEKSATLESRTADQDGANSAVPDGHARLGGARMGEPLALLAHQASRRPALAVAVALAAALGIDWLLAPNSYPVAAAYGVALLIAAQLLSPRGVVVASGAAVMLSLGSNVLQQAPMMAAAADNAGLLAIGVLAFLLARQRDFSEAARQRLELQYAAARALAEGATLQIAASTILSAIARHLGWARGALWAVDDKADVLHCLATWSAYRTEPDRFDEQTRSSQFSRGTGLPGRVWSEGRPLWIRDVQEQANFPRGSVAIDASLHAALAFPVRHGEELLGVIEFFSLEIQQPADGVLALMDAVGAQVGLFMARRKAEDQVSALLAREQSARERAETAVAVRDRFLASVSHDLRSPLSAISGYAQMAQRQIPQLPDEYGDGLRRHLDNIQSAAKRMTAALDELLDLAQLQAGQRLTLRRVRTDLVALARRIIADHQASSKQIQIELSTELGELFGSWDAVRIERVVSNVLSNAIKYSPNGGDIRVNVIRRTVNERELAMIQVEDHGIGISDSDLAHVFEPFWRARRASEASAGTGLGLPGSREVVEQHGGRITVQSCEGVGSTFMVELPLCDNEKLAH
jgi:signal transduction histidine kinase